MGKTTKTRKLNKKRKQKSRKQRGAGVNCYNKEKTWSCSTQCGPKGTCETYD